LEVEMRESRSLAEVKGRGWVWWEEKKGMWRRERDEADFEAEGEGGDVERGERVAIFESALLSVFPLTFHELRLDRLTTQSPDRLPRTSFHSASLRLRSRTSDSCVLCLLHQLLLLRTASP